MKNDTTVATTRAAMSGTLAYCASSSEAGVEAGFQAKSDADTRTADQDAPDDEHDAVDDRC